MTIPNLLNGSVGVLGRGAQGLASDSRSVDALKSAAAKDPKAAIQETAKQFEALFMRELMKSMRQANMSSGWLENSGTQMGTEMLDSQYATMMTGMKGGLSDAITQQLQRQMGTNAPESTSVKLNPLEPSLGAMRARSANTGEAFALPVEGPPPVRSRGELSRLLTPVQITQADFVKQHADAAKAASEHTGIPASFMVAQAAHESGWGRREIKMPDGTNSFNVFGIKAGPRWTGKVAEVTTTEYINGQPQKTTGRFRAYESYEAAFKDYARMLKSSPRYSGVVASASSAEGFARGLQRAGYATDPAYADKLARVINTTMRLQRMVT